MSGAAARELRAVAMVVAAVFTFSLISILTIVATRAGAALSMILLVRYAVAAAVLTVVVRREPPVPLDGARVARVVVVGAIGQSVVAVLTLASLAFIPAATLVVLFYTFPAWVTVLMAVRGTEPLTRHRSVALLLSLAGILALVGLPGGDTLHPLGAGLALVAAVVYALYVPVISHLQLGMSATRAAWLISLGVVAVFAVAAPVRGEFTVGLAPAAWGATIAMGVFSTALGLILFMRGLSALGPVRTAIVSTVEPIFAAILAAVALGQRITIPMMLGGGLIIAAVLLLSRPRALTPR